MYTFVNVFGNNNILSLKVIKDIEKFLKSRDNSDFYLKLINEKKAISNNPKGYWLFFYQIDNQDFDAHKEFGHYHLKIQRALRIMDKILKADIPSKLSKGMNEITKKTEKLINKSPKTRSEILFYRDSIDTINKRISPKELSLFHELQLNTTDLIRNLPKLAYPEIVERYYVNKEGISSSYESYPELPFHMKRSIMGNNFILPLEVDYNGAEVWYGHSVDSKIGQGFYEIWKKSKGQWKCKAWETTWKS